MGFHWLLTSTPLIFSVHSESVLPVRSVDTRHKDIWTFLACHHTKPPQSVWSFLITITRRVSSYFFSSSSSPLILVCLWLIKNNPVITWKDKRVNCSSNNYLGHCIMLSPKPSKQEDTNRSENTLPASCTINAITWAIEDTLRNAQPFEHNPDTVLVIVFLSSALWNLILSNGSIFLKNTCHPGSCQVCAKGKNVNQTWTKQNLRMANKHCTPAPNYYMGMGICMVINFWLSEETSSQIQLTISHWSNSHLSGNEALSSC